ncbi:DUF726-domain-containing protein [Neoconidiobolus thromboides FSU 785]|nr:DUF726-domain-containing protein [Neoconidiobolus thromboides FSU 785]
MGAVFGASSLLAGTSGIALVTSLFGATGAGLAGYRVSRRIGSIKEFTFLPLIKKNELKRRSLNVTIGISGWLKSEEDLISPWKKLKEGDMYCLKYETEILLSIGQALNSLLATSVIGIATNEVLKKTILNGLVASIAWPLTILQAGSILDNPWSLGLDRSKKAGLILADALINYAQGHRPVNLVGFSLGARVIFYCLEELLLRSENNFQLFDIIENVVLLGAPITCDKKRWKAVRTLISGRFINGYIEQDWILSFLHRATSLMKMKENSLNIKNNTIIESVDLSEIVEGHLDYINQVPTILNKLGFQINEFESDVVPETLFETTFTF